MPVATKDASSAKTPLTPRQLAVIQRIAMDVAGIVLNERKEELVRARLSKRMSTLGLASRDDYIGLVNGPRGAAEIPHLIDVLTTNKTSFFRESTHFDFLAHELSALVAGGQRRIRIWCAGCSSGEEAYTIAMTARDALAGGGFPDLKILATDICTPVLETAKRGEYPAHALADVPKATVSRYFESEGSRLTARTVLRSLITFGRLNLMEAWPMSGPFDFIFCRNVMIYFDQDTRVRLTERFAEILRPGGVLFIGHSETFPAKPRGLKYVQPSTYRR